VTTRDLTTGAASPYSAAADLVDPPQLRWRHDPVAWARERGGMEIWSKQAEIMESVRDHPNTAVKSCHSAGKSYVSAALTCWWLDVHPPGLARVITTAPTSKQVDAVLWNEIGRMHRRLGLRGQCNLRDWYIGRELVALGRKPPEHEEAAFQGIHAKYLLVIYDEAYGIPKNLWDEGSSLASNEYARQLAIGNPDGPGEFEEVCRPGSEWNIIHISYRNTPAFTGEVVSRSLLENLVSRRWVDERRGKWGAESALFQSKCEGNFPVGGDPFAVIRHDWASHCRTLEFPEDEPREGGIDVGGGGDRTVLRARYGWRAGDEFEFIDKDPMRTIGRLVEKINEFGLTRVKIDSTGLGWGIAGRIRELSARHNPTGRETTHSAEVIPVQFASRPSAGKEKRLANKRAELWWDVGRENSRLARWDLSNVDSDVIHELTTARYRILDSAGKIQIEKKDDQIKRLGFSPDRAEALLLAYLDERRTGHFSSAAARQLSAANLATGLNPGDALADTLVRAN